jgi:hypothetical protein
MNGRVCHVEAMAGRKDTKNSMWTSNFAGSKVKTVRIQPIYELWFSRDTAEWDAALNRYWGLIQPKNVALEQAMEQLDRERIRRMSPDEWFAFLRDEYFHWKYTAPNRYVTTTSWLKRNGGTEAGRHELHRIRARILDIDPENIYDAISVVLQVPGLGTAGASGLLALLYPEAFGTVDQFVVKALCEIPDLPERAVIAQMKPEGLKPCDGKVLVQIMRRHAKILTNVSGKTWRPRDVDKVLWTYGHKKVSNSKKDCTL